MTRDRAHRMSWGSCRVILAWRGFLPALFITALTAGCDTVPATIVPNDTSTSPSTKMRAEAAALSSTPFQAYQRDGTVVELTHRGDQHFHWYEDAAGFTVVLDTGQYYYADLNAAGELVATQWLVGKVDPTEMGLVPGILPTQEVIDRIRSTSNVKPISTEGPKPEDIGVGYIVIEGDMLVPKEQYEQAKRDASGAVYLNTGLWTNGIVPYEFDVNVSGGNQALMRQAMDDWEAVADVQFVARSAEANYVHIFDGSGNWSYVGMIGGRQDLSIFNWGWEFIMAHELGHALCLWHEQSRSDRDTFVQINWGNIQAGKENNFDIQNGASDSDGGSYDFDSSMHYNAYSFSDNGQPTIEPQPAYAGTSFGQRTHLSVGDSSNMAAVYGAAVSAVKAQMTGPAPGSTLSSTAVTFGWDTGTGVSQYALWVGTAAATFNIYTNYEGSNLSRTVSGLPTDGSTVYVRLWSQISGDWELNDYTYTAMTIALDKAEMTSPTPGSTLGGSSATFQWDTGTSVSQYALWVGTSAGSLNIYTNYEGTNLSRTVSGLPVDGSTVYVRLWSQISGNWELNDYTYTAATAATSKAAMTSPSPGATLGSSTVTFQWDTGSGVSQYALWVGTASATFNLYANYEGTNLSRTVSGLPTDGSTVYVRLWSMIAGDWQLNDYTYTASGGAASAKAVMTSPSSGSTLSGASVTFQWNTGTGVTEYGLWVGTSSGASDLYSGNEGTNLSKAVSGLPVDGSTVYVRLRSQISGAWEFNDTTYTASGGASSKAVMTSPSPGSTLSGASVTFQWNTGTGVTSYGLWVGTSSGGTDLYSGVEGTNLSKAVTGLPTDGSTVYVRLLSQISGAWEFNDYTYTASAGGGSGKAVMTNPSPGSTLDGSAVAFQWNTGTGVSEYALWVGTAAATFDLHANYEGGNLSRTVSGLPSNGSTVYVRLWSMIDGDWEFNDTTYTATSSATSKAVMTGPAPGATLGDSTVTFQWSAGSGVSQYALWVGTSAATFNLYSNYEGTGRSRTVYGIPPGGGTIYVRLWSMIDGDWELNDYTYTAASN